MSKGKKILAIVDFAPDRLFRRGGQIKYLGRMERLNESIFRHIYARIGVGGDKSKDSN